MFKSVAMRIARFTKFPSKDVQKAGGKPGIRADYSANYYAAFLIDPDGNNVEAVYLGA